MVGRNSVLSGCSLSLHERHMVESIFRGVFSCNLTIYVRIKQSFHFLNYKISTKLSFKMLFLWHNYAYKLSEVVFFFTPDSSSSNLLPPRNVNRSNTAMSAVLHFSQTGMSNEDDSCFNHPHFVQYKMILQLWTIIPPTTNR